MENKISGGEAIALGVLNAGVSVVTGYPGAPATGIINAIVRNSNADDVLIEWTSNEKVAIEVAFGASLSGCRALLCVKGVGLNIALDPLMAFNLSGSHSGLVLLVGDDPGGWGSQNEQDSRILAIAAEVPVIEPATVNDAYTGIRSAFQLSEEIGQPVIFRVTRALVQAEIGVADFKQQGLVVDEEIRPRRLTSMTFERTPMKWVVLPVNVQVYHKRVHARMEEFRNRFETMSLNEISGDGDLGIIAVGYAYQKLIDLIGNDLPADMRILKLGCVYPLPQKLLGNFFAGLKSVLILEETAPMLERDVRAFAQKNGNDLAVFGRDTGHVPSVGELFAFQISDALKKVDPVNEFTPRGLRERPLPSRESLCENCPYIPTLDVLMDVMARHGGRDRFIVVGDPGCMVKAQLPPYSLLDVKNSLGSSIAMGAGISLGVEITQNPRLNHPGMGSQNTQKVIVLSGDSGFLHSGINGLMDACRMNATMLLIVLDNGTTALSGGQPHPGSQHGPRGESRSAVELEALIRAVGVDTLQVVNLDHGEDLEAVIEDLIDVKGVSVVIARGECVLYPASK